MAPRDRAHDQAQHEAPATGLYLSIPFCRSKCSFCNFASGVYPAEALPRYIDRLLAELDAASKFAEHHGLMLHRSVDTIYFGGGTPSLLLPAQLGAIFARIRGNFGVQPSAEITLEAAPGFLSDELLAAAVELGITRISFGVQTFVDEESGAVGRLHTAAQALQDVARARRAGLATSLDLIAGLPGQTAASWRRSLSTLIEAAPEHASVYMLEVDGESRLGSEMLLGGTRYGAGFTPSDDAIADFYEEACEVLSRAGLAQYEISNFAHAGCESRHNLRYWQRRAYLGFGLDAHSMLRAAGGEAVRFATTDDLDTYLKASGLPFEAASTFACLESRANPSRLTPAEELEEAWFLGLRRTAGVSLDELRAEFGQDAIDACMPVLDELVEDGLLTRANGHAALTGRGRLLSNEVFARFVGLGDPVAARQE